LGEIFDVKGDFSFKVLKGRLSLVIIFVKFLGNMPKIKSASQKAVI
jgi:hypothetical protein